MLDPALIHRSAEISGSGVYRYRLSRHWDFGKPVMRFIMLNPSTADHNIDDPTIRRCMGFARREGSGGIVVVNLFGFRATSPKALWGLSQEDLEGPSNVGWVTAELNMAAHDRNLGRPGVVVAAWGGSWRPLKRQGIRPFPVLAYAAERQLPIYCLGVTRDGDPRHPLYIPADQPLRPYDGFPL